MTQYDNFLTSDNFKLAYDRLKTASRNLYKSIYYEDLKIFGLYLDENIETVISFIKQDIYKPDKCHKIFIPKKDNLVRPLSMLTFVDMLVYQSITNIIADTAYDIISPYYDKIIFGNIVNTSKAKDKQFFYKSWKRKWKRFNEISKDHFSSGYVYLSEFDIASFFDTIDHNILCELLQNNYNVEKELLELLSKCLETWTADSNHKSFKSKHGIPQGPISSPFLADLYLFYIDSEVKRTAKKLDFKYLRYVDDIRIFSKDKLTSQKLIAALDLISRDLGLIPQGSKILIKKVTDIDAQLKIQNSKFSDITKEYKEETTGKELNKLKAKTHKHLMKRFVNCFNENSEEQYLDKTVIGFSLYKLNADEQVKKLILDNYSLILTHFEGILFYLKKHFPKDNDVIDFIRSILIDENILFNHLVALCFKYFPEYPFDEKIYQTYTFEKHRHWLVNYFMVGWLFANNKKELILTDSSSENYFIQRELNNYKYAASQERSYRKIFATRLLENPTGMLSLQGLNFLFNNPLIFLGFKPTSEQNQFIKYIFSKQPTDIIVHTIKNEWKIGAPETFFNRSIWSDDAEYEELRISFLLFIKTVSSDPSKSLLNLNTFNNLVFDKICSRLTINKVATEYGKNLVANLIDNFFPLCNKHWIEINEKRNQKTEAHPYDKYGHIRLRITPNEFYDLFKKQKLTIEELCNYRGF
ncbi:RNA-directed DNA polymerase [Haliscomenobacter hydrossis]|uniref:RNA-directed DNA polymerase (Reverse transcriptase) n=1 Tax=Haliscomenobacter hydrossis (strain ATCC 27775 / DSM 1100 / LMG 10767 / O) TaxID=760192 RepID=F4L720_HALH1|nr:RNA-directed DNA polymerase [Haliscomenobacter hydrossis]AEE52096.1 RNA-directed DNA polymerase (Reverse transcriptase) [Haliscomenobacter hydrossis DSM 1100]